MSLTSSTSTVKTTMPSWFDAAQQQTASGVTSALNATPSPANLSATGFEKTLTGNQNPFGTAVGGLSNILQGVNTPFNANGTPNTGSPLGALFSAQNAKLDQILPSVAAKEGAAGIGSGNFGSLRGQTAVDTAKAGALTTLAADQDQAALNALTQGVQAGSALGNVGSQYGTSAINSSNWQELGALPAYSSAAGTLANLGQFNTNKATTSDNSTLSNLTAGANFAKNLGILGGNIASGNTGIGWLDSMLKNAGSGLSSAWNSITSPSDPGLSTNTETGQTVNDYLSTTAPSTYDTTAGPTEADVLAAMQNSPTSSDVQTGT